MTQKKNLNDKFQGAEKRLTQYVRMAGWRVLLDAAQELSVTKPADASHQTGPRHNVTSHPGW